MPSNWSRIQLLAVWCCLAWACATAAPTRATAVDPSSPSAPEGQTPFTSHAFDEPTPSAAAPPDAKPVAVYACPMHPEVRDGQPSRCPKCGMTLVPVP